MNFEFKYGLFKLKITDRHAILGIPLDADFKQIRIKYLKIAQKLHPDICRSKNKAYQELANQLLSKLVNPAYEYLSKANYYAEHQLVLTQVGRSFAEKKNKITVASKSAQALLKAGSNLELVYQKELKKLADEQYKNLEQVVVITAQISELNLIYLMLQEKQRVRQEIKPSVEKANSPSASTPEKRSQPPKQEEKPKSNPEAIINSYIRRAKEYIDKDNFSMAIAELRDGLKINPNHSACHGLLGLAYLRNNQTTMAKVHINRAWESNPKDPIAIESKQALDQVLGQKAARSKVTNKTKSGSMLSGWFNAKKK